MVAPMADDEPKTNVLPFKRPGRTFQDALGEQRGSAGRESAIAMIRLHRMCILDLSAGLEAVDPPAVLPVTPAGATRALAMRMDEARSDFNDRTRSILDAFGRSALPKSALPFVVHLICETTFSFEAAEGCLIAAERNGAGRDQ